jgi:hypothetical protein
MEDIAQLAEMAAKFEAASIEDFLANVECDARLTVVANACHIIHASEIWLGGGKICGPREDISDEVFCNTHLRKFYADKSIRLAHNDPIFYRWTNSESEIDLALDRTINPSQNHLHQKFERGLSVVEGPWLYFQHHRHCYLVSGDVLERGSDSEPILDIKTIRVHGRLLKRSETLSDFYNMNRTTISGIAVSSKVEEFELFKFLLGVV